MFYALLINKIGVINFNDYYSNDYKIQNCYPTVEYPYTFCIFVVKEIILNNLPFIWNITVL